MAWVNKFVDFSKGDASGVGDGSPENAWTFRTAVEGAAAAGDVVWCRAPATLYSDPFFSPYYTVGCTGSVANNTGVLFICYNTTYGDATVGNFTSDMSPGGAYSQSPLDALIKGVTAGKSGNVCGGGMSRNMLFFDGVENVWFFHFYFNDIDTAASQLITFDNTPVGIKFVNCKFDDALKLASEQTGDNIQFIDCYVGDGIIGHPVFEISGNGIVYIGNVINITASVICIRVKETFDAVIEGNLIIGGYTSIQARGEIFAKNNILYGATTSVIQIDRPTVLATIYNNIIMPAVGASGYGIQIGSNGGTVLYNDYNCIFGADGNPLTTPIITSKSGGQVPVIGPHSIEVDPLFVDEANNDFRLQPTSPCLKTGKPISGHSLTSIGLGFGEAAPNTPSVTIANGDGSVTVSIAGDSGVTHYVKYRGSSDTAWQDGGSRVGDGDVVVSGLSTEIPYIFGVYSMGISGTYSTPAMSVSATLLGDVQNNVDEELLRLAKLTIAKVDYEIVTHIPMVGDQREIKAIVDRNTISSLGNVPHGKAAKFTITVVNDSAVGISSSEINTGGDKVKLVYKLGQDAQERLYRKVLSQDAGMITLEVQ